MRQQAFDGTSTLTGVPCEQTARKFGHPVRLWCGQWSWRFPCSRLHGHLAVPSLFSPDGGDFASQANAQQSTRPRSVAGTAASCRRNATCTPLGRPFATSRHLKSARHVRPWGGSCRQVQRGVVWSAPAWAPLPPQLLLRQCDAPRPVRPAAAQVFPTPWAATDTAASTRRQSVAPTRCQRARRGRRQDRGVVAHHDRREGQGCSGRRLRPSQWSMLATEGGHVVPRRRGMRRVDVVLVVRHGPAAHAAATADVAAAATPAPFGGWTDTATAFLHS